MSRLAPLLVLAHVLAHVPAGDASAAGHAATMSGRFARGTGIPVVDMPPTLVRVLGVHATEPLDGHPLGDALR